MKSIMQKKDGTCYLCMMLHSDFSTKQTQEHHAIYGMGRRKLAEKYGLKIYLCFRHHTADGGSEAVHRNAEIDRIIKRKPRKPLKRDGRIWISGRYSGRTIWMRMTDEIFRISKKQDRDCKRQWV